MTPSAPLFDLAAAFTAAVGQITAQIGAVLPIVLPVGGGLIALGLAWRTGRKFLKG